MEPKFVTAFQLITQVKLIASPSLILMALTNRRKEGWNVSELVKLTGLSAPTLGMAKDSLVKRGWVEEHVPARDRRKLKLYLTPAGEKEAALRWKAAWALVNIETSYRGSSPPA